MKNNCDWYLFSYKTNIRPLDSDYMGKNPLKSNKPSSLLKKTSTSEAHNPFTREKTFLNKVVYSVLF